MSDDITGLLDPDRRAFDTHDPGPLCDRFVAHTHGPDGTLITEREGGLPRPRPRFRTWSEIPAKVLADYHDGRIDLVTALQRLGVPAPLRGNDALVAAAWSTTGKPLAAAWGTSDPPVTRDNIAAAAARVADRLDKAPPPFSTTTLRPLRGRLRMGALAFDGVIHLPAKIGADAGDVIALGPNRGPKNPPNRELVHVVVVEPCPRQARCTRATVQRGWGGTNAEAWGDRARVEIVSHDAGDLP